jgi:hypothetical protein
VRVRDGGAITRDAADGVIAENTMHDVVNDMLAPRDALMLRLRAASASAAD